MARLPAGSDRSARSGISVARYTAVGARRLRRHGKLNSALADKMTENVAVMLNARAVRTKRKAWRELPMSPRSHGSYRLLAFGLRLALALLNCAPHPQG